MRFDPGTLTHGIAAEVHEFLINYPDRATEITIVATDLQDDSVQRLNAVAPTPQAAPAEIEIEDADSSWIETLEKAVQKTPGQRARRKRRRASAQEGEAAAAGASSAEPAEFAALVSSHPRSYRRADASNQFVVSFPVNSGSGVRLGQAITISTLLIQGSFSKEDRTDHQDHRRQVQSAMLNVYSEVKIGTPFETGDKVKDAMRFCMMCLSALTLECPDRYKSENCENVEGIPVFGPQLLGLIKYCNIRACFAGREEMHKV